MVASIHAPNVDNYLVGKGKVFWRPDGATDLNVDGFLEIGNVPEIESTPSAEKLDHFSSREGVQRKDKSAVTQQSMQLRMIMEEFIPENLRIMTMGSEVRQLGNVAQWGILSTGLIRGAIRHVGTNDIGPRLVAHIPQVEFSPSGSLNLISEEWGQAEVTGEALYQEADGDFGKFYGNYATYLAPTNTVPPAITGTPTETQELVVSNGTWENFWADVDGAPIRTFSYQWYRDAVAINGACRSRYTLTAADVGAQITCGVIGHNGAGSTQALSDAVGPVAAYE
jgi:hypothetical protein